jgi:hypothetical protein
LEISKVDDRTIDLARSWTWSGAGFVADDDCRLRSTLPRP